MNWHPHTERPELDAPASGLIATRDDYGVVYVLGMHVWDGGCWVDEYRDRLAPALHWWISEDELTEGIR